MALARAFTVALVGLDGHVVEVEADLAQGLPGLTVIGLPDAALAEARDRVRAAIVNSGYAWPQRRITLALSPAWLPKRGSGFDLSRPQPGHATAHKAGGAWREDHHHDHHRRPPRSHAPRTHRAQAVVRQC